MLACPLGGGERGLVASETIVQHGADALHQTEGSSLALGGRVPGTGFAQLQRPGLVPAPGGEEQRGVSERSVAGRGRDRIRLLDQRRGRGELPSVYVHAGAVFEAYRKDVERSGLASEPDRVSGQVVPRLVVPQVAGEEPCQPKPAQGVALTAQRLTSKRLQGAHQGRPPRPVPLV